MSRDWNNLKYRLGKKQHCLEETVDRNMNDKGASGKVSGRNEEHVSGNWRKVDPCYRVSKYLAEPCSGVLWKVEVVSDKIGYLAKKISRQSVEGTAWFFFKKESLCKMESELEDFKKFSVFLYCKKKEREKLRSGGKMKCVAVQSFAIKRLWV